ncbi:MAG: hypothetical protein DRI69_05120 [Bacteroidetes bacterium]|nr:MAG: hypothetical protein DRI69_05120 [Bacteroidota bacterium]
MKFPHLKLLFFMALLALTSCDKENLELSNDQLTQDPSIGMRCCDDATTDMMEDPRFLDFYDGFTNGVFDPIVAILDEFDSEEFTNELIAFEECTTAGGSYEACLGLSPILTRLIAVLEGFDMELLNALIANYDYLDREEINSVILDAVDQSQENQGRRLPCFDQFQSDVIDATVAMGGTSIVTGGVPAAIGIVVAIVVARLKFCRCLYSTYGYGC